MLKCITREEAEYVLKKIHEGCCRDHVGAMMLTGKALLAKFCWPTMTSNSIQVVLSYDRCQRYSNFQHSPTAFMKPFEHHVPLINEF